MKYFMEKWKEILFIVAVVSAALTFNGLRIQAQEAQKKVVQFEQTFARIAQKTEGWDVWGNQVPEQVQARRLSARKLY
jgi:hypothetical protein